MGEPVPVLVPLGDAALLVRFADRLNDDANRAAVAFARQLESASIAGVDEVVPSLVSVLLRFDPRRTTLEAVAGELRLVRRAPATTDKGEVFDIPVRFDGADLPGVAAALNRTTDAFVADHNAAPLRVLATGFAPGFLYCGFHPEPLHLPRRAEVRRSVPAGTVLFAAGQTAIASTAIPTGWHVIGQTAFRNFDPSATPPTRVRAGDRIRFEVER